MDKSLYLLSAGDLILSLIPLILVILIVYFWKLTIKTYVLATVRMAIQLILIGFVLTFIFRTQYFYIIILALFVMLFVAAWIALRPIAEKRKESYWKALISLFCAGFLVLFFIVFAIIQPHPWYKPTYLIPLAGMIFANSMNALSLGAERFFREKKNGLNYIEARNAGLTTALIPVTNTFFAVGLVSLPGMMTGQILAGIDPLIAVRYQILIMTTLFGSAGLSSAVFLYLQKYDD